MWFYIHRAHPVKPGFPGHKIFITNLENYVQPFIRYEVPDVVEWEGNEKSCSCNASLPVIKDVSGRTDDILYIKQDEGGYQMIHPYRIMVPLLHFHEIKEWQVVQRKRNCLELFIVPKANQSIDVNKIKTALHKSFIHSQVSGTVEWKIKEVTAIHPDQKTGKKHRIRSTIAPPAPVSGRFFLHIYRPLLMY